MQGNVTTSLCHYCGRSFVPTRGTIGKYCSRACYRGGSTSFEDRFWVKVEKTEGCWEWRGAISGHGWPYGHIRSEAPVRTMLKAHRVSWELHFGPIPDGLLVCHHCDNTLCVRPDHLFLGTSKHNTQDMIRKGRHGKPVRQKRPHGNAGERNRGNRITAKDVIAIRQMFAAGTHTRKELAGMFGLISHSAISNIVTFKNWKHIK